MVCVVLQSFKTAPMANTYFEDLIDDCPDADARVANNEIFYRLVSVPTADEDFHSHRKKYPLKKFNVSECQARSVSVFRNSPSHKIEKLPAFKDKIRALVQLTSSDGVIKPTPSDQDDHHSWWRSSTFKIGNNVTYP